MAVGTLLAVPLLSNGFEALFSQLAQAGFTEARLGIMQTQATRMNGKCTVTQTLATNDYREGDALDNVSRITGITRKAIEDNPAYIGIGWNPPVAAGTMGFFTLWFAVDPGYCLKPPPTGLLPVADAPLPYTPTSSSITVLLALVAIFVLSQIRKIAPVGHGGLS
jgi:hypothetical protein